MRFSLVSMVTWLLCPMSIMMNTHSIIVALQAIIRSVYIWKKKERKKFVQVSRWPSGAAAWSTLLPLKCFHPLAFVTPMGTQHDGINKHSLHNSE